MTTPRQSQVKGPCAATDKRMASISQPLDFCFLNITDVSEMLNEEPRLLPGKKKPEKKNEKWLCSIIKLNNNVLQELKDFVGTVELLLPSTASLEWVDLSCNELTTIDPCFAEFVNLKILNLHGNQIKDLKEVDKLTEIPKLSKLTLHGNPIESQPDYKWYVLSRVPNLWNFDMSGVTKSDRTTMSIWVKRNPIKKKKTKTEDD